MQPWFGITYRLTNVWEQVTQLEFVYIVGKQYNQDLYS